MVYIYNGASTGLHLKYSQRILGRDIDAGLRAFGYAISRPWDIDGNYYDGESELGLIETTTMVRVS